MTFDTPTLADMVVPEACTAPSVEQRHERAVAQTLRWAQEAADRDAFGDALDWLDVVEVVEGDLAPGWKRTQSSWRLAVVNLATGQGR
jgi:hypothetical protein